MKQFWVGYTKAGFAKWLVEKSPDNDHCPYSFFSENNDGKGGCEEIAILIELPESKFKAYSKVGNSPDETTNGEGK